MKVFTYSFLYRLFLKYGNVPLNIMMVIYLVLSIGYLHNHIFTLIPISVSILFIVIMNRQYVMMYKIVPFRIEAYDDHLVCSKFMFRKKKVEVYFGDIERLHGGIYEGKLKGVLKVYDGKQKITIGYFSGIKNSQDLGTILLSKVKKPVYDEVITKISEAGKRKK